jgi:hypothetical protein
MKTHGAVEVHLYAFLTSELSGDEWPASPSGFLEKENGLALALLRPTQFHPWRNPGDDS